MVDEPPFTHGMPSYGLHSWSYDSLPSKLGNCVILHKVLKGDRYYPGFFWVSTSNLWPRVLLPTSPELRTQEAVGRHEYVLKLHFRDPVGIPPPRGASGFTRYDVLSDSIQIGDRLVKIRHSVTTHTPHRQRATDLWAPIKSHRPRT